MGVWIPGMHNLFTSLYANLLTSWEDQEIRVAKEAMAYRTYTDKDIPAQISCEGTLRELVEEFVSPRERVRRILAGVRELVGEGLKKGISRQRLLRLINESEEMKDRTKISPSQFARYCREQFGCVSKNGKVVKKDGGFGAAINEQIERRGSKV